MALLKFLIILASFFVALVAAVLIVPSFVNWNQYRSTIQNEAAAVVGRPVEIDGDIRIQLVPAPRLVIEKARLSNIEGASSADMITLERLEVHVALAPLFSGAVRVQSVILVKPEVRLEILEDGPKNFTFDLGTGTPSAKMKPPAQSLPPASSRTEGAPDGKLFAFRPQLSIHNFTIEDGRVLFLDAAAGRTETIENLNGRFAMAALKGPWEASGSALVRGIPLSFLGSAGTIVQGRTLPFNFDLTAIPGSVRAQFSGVLTNIQEAPSAKGKIAITGKNLEKFLSAMAGVPALSGVLARPFDIDAKVLVSAKESRITDIGVRFSDSQMTGTISVKAEKETEISVSLSTNRLNLDTFLVPSPIPVQPSAKGTIPPPSRSPHPKSTGASAAKSVGGKAGAAAFDLTRLPDNLSASVNLSAAAVTWRGQPIRQAKLNYSLANREITLNQFSALLPGNTDVALFGFISQKDGAPEFEGNLDSATSDLRKLLAWLDIDTDGIPRERLRQFKFTAKLSARPDVARLQNFNLRFDGTTVRGNASVVFSGRPDVDARLSVDRINLDSYLAKAPKSPPTGTATPPTNARTAAGALPGNTEVTAGLPALGGLAGFDVQLRAKVKTLILRGLPVRGIGTDMVLADGKFRIDRLQVADAAGIGVGLSGTLAGLDQANPKLDNVQFQIAGNDLNRFFKLLRITPPFPVRGLGRLVLAGRASGGLGGIAFKADTEAFGGKLVLDGRLKNLIGTPTFETRFTIRHRDLARLVRNLGTDYRPKNGRAGSLNLTGFAAGTLKNLKITNLECDVGGVPVGGNLDMDLTGPVPRIDAKLSSGDIDLDRFLPAPKNAALAPASPLLHRASWPGLPAPAFMAPPLGIRAQAERWSRSAIDLTALNQFGGRLTVTSDSVKLGKLRLVKAALNARLDRGTLNINKLTGLVFGGELHLDGSLAAHSRRAQLVARYTVNNLDAAAAQAAFGGRQITRGRFDTNGELDAVGRNQAELIASLTGRGTVALSRVEVAALGTENTVLVAVGNLFRAITQFGATLGGKPGGRLADINGAYTITKGVVRFDDLTLSSDLAKGSVRGSADLPRWHIQADGQLALAEALVTRLLMKNTSRRPTIPFSVTGSIDNPTVKLETTRLPGGGIRLPVPALDNLRKKNPDVGWVLDEILPGLIGQPAPAPTPSPTASSPPPAEGPETAPPPSRHEMPKVENLLKGILRGLSR